MGRLVLLDSGGETASGALVEKNKQSFAGIEIAMGALREDQKQIERR